ncbi:11979_t:CDS:1, partial [Gigaspora rosea]
MSKRNRLVAALQENLKEYTKVPCYCDIDHGNLVDPNTKFLYELKQNAQKKETTLHESPEYESEFGFQQFFDSPNDIESVVESIQKSALFLHEELIKKSVSFLPKKQRKLIRQATVFQPAASVELIQETNILTEDDLYFSTEDSSSSSIEDSSSSSVNSNISNIFEDYSAPIFEFIPDYNTNIFTKSRFLWI